MDAQMMYQRWLDHAEGLRSELEELKENLPEINRRFSGGIKFGTAGLRGIVGAGTNRMNIYTVGQATQAVANWLRASKEHPKVAIAYDTRKDSYEFAKKAAEVLCANEISVKLFSEVTPTPVLAYYVRNHQCDGGIVITASHNPSDYNGFKVYECDGGQLRSHAASVIEDEMTKVDLFEDVKGVPLKKAEEWGLFSYIGEEIKQEYIAYVLDQTQKNQGFAAENLSVVYTPLNGTGAKYLPQILEKMGVKQLHLVTQQMEPDGEFRTCTYPNPESAPALKLGLEECEKHHPDLFIATDPDADRVRIGVLHGGKMELLSGNQMGILLLDYLANRAKQAGTLKQNAVFVRTVVSSPMTDKVAEHYGVQVQVVLTGFKNVAERLEALEKNGNLELFLFAYEESIGFLPSAKVWDKDGVCCAGIFTQMCGQYKKEGKTLVDHLESLYKKYGYYLDDTQNYVFEGENGKEKMDAIMEKMKTIPLTELAALSVVSRIDYTNQESNLRSNLVQFTCEGGTTILMRPSGTEPKIKAYITAVAENEADGSEIIKKAVAMLHTIIKNFS